MLIFLSVKLSRADCWCFADITLHQHEAWSGYESECHVKLMTEAAAGKQKGKVWAIDHLQQLERENESPSSPWNTIFFPSTGSLVQVCKTTGRCKAKPERDKGCVDQKLQKWKSLRREKAWGEQVSVVYHGLSGGGFGWLFFSLHYFIVSGFSVMSLRVEKDIVFFKKMWCTRDETTLGNCILGIPGLTPLLQQIKGNLKSVKRWVILPVGHVMCWCPHAVPHHSVPGAQPDSLNIELVTTKPLQDPQKRLEWCLKLNRFYHVGSLGQVGQEDTDPGDLTPKASNVDSGIPSRAGWVDSHREIPTGWQKFFRCLQIFAQMSINTHTHSPGSFFTDICVSVRVYKIGSK